MFGTTLTCIFTPQASELDKDKILNQSKSLLYQWNQVWGNSGQITYDIKLPFACVPSVKYVMMKRKSFNVPREFWPKAAYRLILRKKQRFIDMAQDENSVDLESDPGLELPSPGIIFS
jgi:hypothetical protein